MEIEMRLAGFFFLLIIITNILSVRFGTKVFSDLDSDAKLQTINNNPKKFKISTVLLLIEHGSIIFLAVMLFIAFQSDYIILGIIWIISRGGEGLIQIYNKKDYWSLLNLAEKYSNTSGAEKNELIDLGRSILKTKNFIFTFAQLLFSIGTLAYSIVFVTTGGVLSIFGWFGIVASILYGFGAGITLIKPDFDVLWKLGGLLIFIFEIVLGGWLLFF